MIKNILTLAYGKEISDAIFDSFSNVEKYYFLHQWETLGLEAGHFVESTRRLLEWELFGHFTPFNTKLSNFNEKVLKSYEQVPKKEEAFRIVIPRALFLIYTFRNKRGIGHVSDVLANRLDATFILGNVKWVVGEIIRLKSNMDFDETQHMIDKIINRKLSILWDENGITRVIDTSLKKKNQVLVLLYQKGPLLDLELQKIIEYKNTSRFKQVLQNLHRSRIIEYANSGICTLSPSGTLITEDIIYKKKLNKNKAPN